ncbi:C6 zink-finger PRO1A [Fusarium napiforme]|uniref:C6 zink-finger PRO1A n=1 Tax=Fusarium napiforme TaxID=42672 RepID=A0A8H5ICS4_9HYPO|nr:C6 zink-finger PRO1A [Fusarium napiforme]
MVHITPFAVEQWMDTYEITPGVLNVAETCAASVSIDDLVAMSSSPAKNPIDTSVKLTYGEIPGSQTLRERIAAHCSTEGVQLLPEDVIVTQGAIGANFLALYTLISPGDHVICVYPTYQQLYDTPRSLGAEVTLWKLKKENGFVPDVDELAGLIKPNTKMIIINNPNNPTGAPIPNSVIDRIAKVAEDKGIILFSDEVYRPLFHGGASGGDHTEVPRPVTTLDYQKTIATGSMSKGYALAGIRVGWIASRDRSIISAIMLARDYTTISVSQIDDQIARFALSPDVKPALVQRNMALARTNAAILKDFMDRYKSVCSWVEPKAGTTAFIRFNDKNGDPVDDVKLCLDLLEKAKLLFVAGSRCFGGDEDFKGYVRMGYFEAVVTRLDKYFLGGQVEAPPGLKLGTCSDLPVTKAVGPEWMDGSDAEHRELERIKRAVNQYLRKLRRIQRNQSLGRDATGRSPPERRTPNQTPSAPGVIELSSPSLSERGLNHGYDNFESPNTLLDAGSSLSRTRGSTYEEQAAQPVSPPCILQSSLASLIMYYLDHVFVWQFPYYQIKSCLGNRGWLLTYLSNNGSLSHAALALPTLHRDASQKSYSYSQEAFEFHSMALRELRKLSQHTGTERPLNDRAKLAEFIAASLTLISFEVGHWSVFNGAEYDWVPHLDAVTAVVAMQSPDVLLQTSSSFENASPSPMSIRRGDDPQLQGNFNFLIAEAVWHDILACATTGRVPRIPYRQWLEGSGLQMSDLMSCYNWVMIAIGDLAHLQAWKKDMKQKGALSVPELVRRGQRIEKKLQDGITELKQTIKAGGGTRGGISPAPHVSHIFALASLVLSSTIVSGPCASLPEIRDAVSESVNVLRDWPQAIPLRGLVWPLYIIGCMARASLQGVFESVLSRILEESG